MTTLTARGQQAAVVFKGGGTTVVVSDDSIASSNTHFFELKMGVSAPCVCVYTAGGLKQQWQMG